MMVFKAEVKQDEDGEGARVHCFSDVFRLEFRLNWFIGLVKLGGGLLFVWQQLAQALWIEREN